MKKFSEIDYSRPNIESYKTDFLSLLEHIKSASNYEKQKELIYECNRLSNKIDTAAILVNIRFSMDTNDTFYESEKEWWNNTSPELSLLSQKYYEAISSSPFKKELEQEFGDQLFTIAAFQIRKIDDRIVQDRKEENKLRSSYFKLKASAEIDWEGEVLNLSQLAAHTLSSNRTIRKKAADATFDFLGENSKEFDRIFDELTHLRDRMAKKIGFENFVELGYCQMMRSDYTPEMVANYRKKILDYIVPLVEKLKEKQAKRIGLDKLKHYDEAYKFKTGNPEPKGSYQWIIESGQKMYEKLSPETAEFFHFMRENELMDLETRKGKKTGGYCTFLPSLGAPFIFSNFNGTAADMKVLVHEAGHAFQKYQSKHFQVSEYLWPTKESAEIHSMSMEYFTWPWMELFFKEDTEKYKFQHLASALEFLPYGACVDEFQHSIYENPTMTPAERKSLWKMLEIKYRPNLDYDGNQYAEEGTRWQLQSHIYESPFYYIDYTLAQVCALQFWVRMQDDFEGAWKDYLKLCRAGGSMSFLKLVELAGLQSPFEDGVIEEVTCKVEAYLDAVDDANF